MKPSESRGAYWVVNGKNAGPTGAPDVADVVRQGVRKAQEKLIDLSLRNGMLNFRHSETSTRHVRVIDEGIAFLVDALNSGRSLDLIPVPPVEEVPRDEDTDVFRAAVQAAKEIDSKWLAAEDARRAVGNRRSARDKGAERALRDRVRAQLGMPECRVATDPETRARDLGINPDYDLPPPTPKSERRHRDDTLQTLLFPDRLEAKLSALHSAARALQEDAGLNALHCAVGFLEWYDPADTSDPCYAPLLLLPINIEKRISQGEYIYSIQGRDDDVTANVALREKLKQLALDLPEYDPEDGVEKFLKQVGDVLRNRPRWRIRRFATIGLFSFSRQVMWADLDPAKWPASARPESHPLLGQIYGDLGGDYAEIVAPVYDVDDPILEQRAPATVTDADASQLSAVIDAANGKNLVIQGSPGTGKSQAITNIVANALWHGKSVLFVSEKMAALNVVKSRLDNIGLGSFCLAVHSTKASKSLVLKAIRERMESPRVRPNAQVIARARDACRDARQRLTEYAALINSPAGATGLTIHQVLWGDLTRFELPETVPVSALEFRLHDPLAIDRFKLDELVAVGRTLDQLALSMGIFAEPRQQPWRGIGNLNLRPFDRAKAVELVQRWSTALEDLHNQAALFADTFGWTRAATLADLAEIAQVARDIPDPPLDLDGRILACASNGTFRQSAAFWANNALQAAQHEASAAAIAKQINFGTNLDLAKRILTEASQLRVSEATPIQLARLAAQAQKGAEARAAIVQLIEDVLTFVHLGPKREIDHKVEAMVTGYLYHVARLATERRRLRSSALSQDGIVEALVDADATAAEARGAAEQAGFEEPPTVHLAQSLPSVAEMRAAAAATLRGASRFARLGRDWRSARTVWRRTFRSEKRMLHLEAGRRLLAAALWKEKLAQLEANRAAKMAAGRLWRSADTPFEELVAVAHWMKSIRNITPPAEPGALELRRVACEANTDDFAVIVSFANRAKELKILDAFKAAHAEGSSIVHDAGRLAERAAALMALFRDVEAIGLSDNQPVEILTAATEALERARESRQAMAAESVASAASGIAASTDAERAKVILSTLAHAECVSSLRVPSPVIAHLLAPECAVRTAVLKRQTSGIQQTLAQEREVAESVRNLLNLRVEDWCGGPLEAVTLDALIAKCQNAVQNPVSLEKQVDLLSTELEADRLGLSDLIRHWTTKGLRYAGVGWAVEAVFYRSAAEKLMRDLPVLASHAGNTHEQVRTRFQKLDREILELNRSMIAAKLHEQSIPPGRRAPSVRDYTDNEMLSHQAGLQQPRIALRRLFSNAGAAIRAYMPCLMMSPMSVAQYLEPGKHNFDILVVDEASQMKPENALGAMLRCSQAVIVGDPQQLPPTDFFAVTSDGSDRDARDEPEESILELGLRCWHPMRMLEVHYRSRHQSLIAYSNHEFYGDRLLVYPSPVRQDPAYGVSYHRVDGAYETGQGRNRIEAEAVVEEAARLMCAHLDRSLGIVAINQAQSDLIEALMDQRVASDPELQAYKQRWSGELEDFFIKNLENVQGDERDSILVSTVYGRTAEGVFHQHFGPINRSYGHRRLNVLFTRAKCKLAVFTSLDHGQIVANGNSRGVRVLKEFLEYAASGTTTPGRSLGDPPDSDFERWFLSRLKVAGYDAHPHVGVAKYRIDIGVVHPDRPANYILGVECDGARYHSSKAARDRDRLRQDVLEGLNWTIHPVWSTDWYRNPEREFSRLVRAIEGLRAIS